jgi:hypothetical protein
MKPDPPEFESQHQVMKQIVMLWWGNFEGWKT